MISIVIPTLNEQEYLPLLLGDIQRQTVKPTEVIVVDGGSNDKTQSIAASFSFVKLLVASQNPSIQRNLGGKKANGDLLIFLDADVRIYPGFLKHVLNGLKQKKVTVACPRYSPITQFFTVKAIFNFFNSIFWLGQRHYPSGAGCCIIVKKSVFLYLKGFNHILLNDDLDFIYRAGKIFPFAVLPQPVYVSDRRFQKYGIWKTFGQYLQVSYHFLKGNLSNANTLAYPFGTFNRPAKQKMHLFCL